VVRVPCVLARRKVPVREAREEARRDRSAILCRMDALGRKGLDGLARSGVGLCSSGTLSSSSSGTVKSRTGVVDRGVRGMVGGAKVRTNSSLSEANFAMTSSNVVEFRC
jgi:hypothetical protein